jgi:hypothetical protein
MARTGILYSDVMKAAQIVAADGRNPTVDNVREALGSTGSKSTIAPLLKRWKEEFQGAGAVKTEAGLPAELMEAMRGVYEKQQRDVAQQLETGMQQNRAERDAALEKLKKTEMDRLKLTEARAALTQELRATQHALAQLKEEHHFRAVTLATLHSDNAGLTQRLADRSEEIAALNRQLAQVRSQFDHYQEAAATQRRTGPGAAACKPAGTGQRATAAAFARPASDPGAARHAPGAAAGGTNALIRRSGRRP